MAEPWLTMFNSHGLTLLVNIFIQDVLITNIGHHEFLAVFVFFIAVLCISPTGTRLARLDGTSDARRLGQIFSGRN